MYQRILIPTMGVPIARLPFCMGFSLPGNLHLGRVSRGLLRFAGVLMEFLTYWLTLPFCCADGFSEGCAHILILGKHDSRETECLWPLPGR